MMENFVVQQYNKKTLKSDVKRKKNYELILNNSLILEVFYSNVNNYIEKD